MLQWIEEPKDKTFAAQFAINCKTALMELGRHPKEVFNNYMYHINRYLRHYGTSYVIHTTWEQERAKAIRASTQPH